MLNINVLIKRMKNRLPDPVYKAVDQDFFIDILFSETLPAMSVYYPKVIKGISVIANMGIRTTDSLGKVNNSCKYVIPLMDEMYPYIGISTFYYPRNFGGGGTYLNPGLVDALASRIMSSMAIPDIKFTASFESPNIIQISPPPLSHEDFTVAMYAMKKLEEIKSGYHETFKELFEADCKIALYYKFFTVSDGGTYGGIDIKDYVGSFKDYESTRKELLETMETDYYKDPDRFEEILSYNPGYA